MKNNIQFILLATTKTGEKSIVLHTLSKDYGRRSFIVSASKVPGAYLQPLSILEAEICETPKATLWRATAITAVQPLGSIRGSISKNTITLFMSEVLYRAIREDAFEEGLYDWCERSILTLDALQEAFPNFHLRWLLELCLQLGFRPDARDLAPFAGGLYPELELFMKTPFAESMLLPYTGAKRNEMAQILLKYLSHHLEVQLNIRSLDVLRDLYNTL